jgi:hypothetical protein
VPAPLTRERVQLRRVGPLGDHLDERFEPVAVPVDAARHVLVVLLATPTTVLLRLLRGLDGPVPGIQCLPDDLLESTHSPSSPRSSNPTVR